MDKKEQQRRCRQYRQTLTFRERYLTHHENPILFLLFSWRLYYYDKVVKGIYNHILIRGK